MTAQFNVVLRETQRSQEREKAGFTWTMLRKSFFAFSSEIPAPSSVISTLTKVRGACGLEPLPLDETFDETEDEDEVVEEEAEEAEEAEEE